MRLKLTIYGYVRISTDMQDYESQKSAIGRRFRIQKWIKDTGSGRITQPNLLKLIKNCTNKDEIVVAAFDRLGRNTATVLEIVRSLQKKGISIHSIREGVDLNSSAGNMVFQMLCSIAEFESKVTGDRVRQGLKAAIERGVSLGPPRLDSTKQGKKQMERAVKLRQRGLSLRCIKEKLQNSGFKISIASLSEKLRDVY